MAALDRLAVPAPPFAGRPRPGKVIVAFAVAILVATALFQVNQFSRLTSAGYEIDALDQQRADRQAENHQLEASVAQLSSLARVEWEARVRLGLAPAERRLYIDVNGPVPDRQTLPSRFLPAAHTPGVQATEPLWRWLLRALPFF